jgi:UDPglucose 6-dehydrogenase
VSAKVVVIGTGYVGLVSGACLADLGNRIVCIDKDHTKIDALRSGIIPIYEPGLEEVITRNVEAGRISFEYEPDEALNDTDAVLLAVGTPTDSETGRADLRYVFGAVEEVISKLSKPIVFITKSTVPVGTGSRILDLIKNKRPDLDCCVVSNPEFLREGSAVYDFMHPDRIIVGTHDEVGQQLMQTLYQPLVGRGYPLLFTNIPTAELIKYASNAFLATKIAFINEVADICEGTGAQVDLVTKGMGMDERIGGKYMQPGPGFGGSCFPKDTLALTHIANDAQAPSQIVDAVIASNDDRKKRMVEKIVAAFGGDVKGKRVAILGLTFKANTDDMRYSASLVIIPALVEAGAEVRVYDPQGMKQAKMLLDQDISWCLTKNEALSGADGAVIVTEWDEFLEIDLLELKAQLASPLLVDLRNLFPSEEMKAHGFTYVSIGR